MNSIAVAGKQAPEFFKVLAHEIRWRLLQLLARSDYSGQELVRLLSQPQNLVSYHLRLLAEHHLVRERRSSADERSIYYSLDLEILRTLYFGAGDALHPLLATSQTEETLVRETVARLAPLRILFLCTHNSARSQMAEGILRYLGAGRIDVMSAGNHPTALHPLAVQACASIHIDIGQQRAKPLDELHDLTFDYIITVCDRVRESCPTFPGDPERLHWSLPDPALAQGSEQERVAVFEQTCRELLKRIRSLLLSIEQEHAPHAEGSSCL
ncbi:ArsR family transcriptional regulator [Reticulibacter mediterranei]|uniref:ArsR family transcriptional regulator n=1 Tax=Reticulibacter mediterranei TaxID=2778369 RepID=A0A8J3IMH9_9CHLR|nr:helix-turn-helix domain-containing protein [Reticulibacter mediterranei]GHO95098.1 ArsR family transcriptional regulator [Reticulibacter mediterranei]